MNNEDKINDLEPIAESGKMSTWEIDFVANVCIRIGGGQELSKAQQDKLDELHKRYC